MGIGIKLRTGGVLTSRKSTPSSGGRCFVIGILFYPAFEAEILESLGSQYLNGESSESERFSSFTNRRDGCDKRL